MPVNKFRDGLPLYLIERDIETLDAQARIRVPGLRPKLSFEEPESQLDRHVPINESVCEA
jgi:hypothetical protein